MSAPDHLDALATYLKADAAVAALAAARVFSGELPEEETESMPRYAVVLQPSGGGVFGGGNQAYGDSRVDVDCYGATPSQGWALYLAVSTALKALQGELVGACLIKWARPSSKGTTARDPDTGWPLTVSSWQVLHGEQEEAA